MTTNEIIEALAYPGEVFPQQAVEEAVADREAVIPELLRVLNAAISSIAEIAAQDDYMGHIFAMFLLAQFREEQAYQPLINLVSGEPMYVDEALGDVITEDLGKMLACVCNGDISLICGMIEDPNVTEYVRSAGLDALVILVARGIKTREEIMEYFLSLFQGKLEREHGFIWGSLVCHCCDIYALEAADEIERAFTDNIVETELVTRKDVKRSLAQSKEKTLELLVNEPNCKLIDDTALEMSQWPCFQPAPKSTKVSAIEQFGKPVEARTQPKVGRNEPCPCGSGKKYKKCCGA